MKQLLQINYSFLKNGDHIFNIVNQEILKDNVVREIFQLVIS